MRSNGGSRRLFWAVGGTVVVLDVITKVLAVRGLSRVPQRVLGDWLTLQLVYNPGAAFGLSVGVVSSGNTPTEVIGTAAKAVSTVEFEVE